MNFLKILFTIATYKMHNMQIRNPVVCDASKVSLYKKIQYVYNMSTSERRIGRNSSQSDQSSRKINYLKTLQHGT